MPSQRLTNGLIGAGTTRRTTTPEFTLGTVGLGENNETYVYVQATAAIAATAVAVVTAAFLASTGAGSYTADTAFAAGEYGFIRKTATPL